MNKLKFSYLSSRLGFGRKPSETGIDMITKGPIRNFAINTLYLGHRYKIRVRWGQLKRKA